MSMTARERVMAVLAGEEPDKIPVIVQLGLRPGPPGGWMRRLAKRGMGFSQLVGACNPWNIRSAWMFTLPHGIPYLEDVKCTQIHYYEKGIVKFREIIETPVGSITDVVRFSPPEERLGGG